jgi:hypothetical protein
MNRGAAIKLVISLCFGVFLGIVLGLFRLGLEGGILAGMLLTVIAEMFFVLVAQDDARRVNLALINLAEALPQGRSFPNFISQTLISSLHDRTIELLEQGIEIKAKRVPLFWTTCVLNVDTSLNVAAYIAAENWWERPYSLANVSAQKGKAAEGKAISRVFIWKEQEEVERLLAHARDQQEAGISVQHISIAELDADKSISAWLANLGTPDVALIDGQWTVLHFLDEQRDTVRLVVSRDPVKVQATRAYLDLLQQAAHPFSFIETSDHASRAPVAALGAG